MATYKTPGVFIEEIQTIAPSVAPVPTAIPGFVGYTEKAINLDGSSALNQPVRITSLLEYQQIFGGPFHEQFAVALTGTVPAPTNIAISVTLSNYILFYQLQMFYANGGGTCYIVSVGNYSNTITDSVLKAGLDILEQVDEVTLLVVPENVFATNPATVNDAMLTQCTKLQSRFAIMDVLHVNGNTILQDADNFRNSNVGADNLKYGGAYYPPLTTVLNYFYNPDEVIISDSRTPGLAPFNYTYNNAPNNTLSTINNGIRAYIDVTIGTAALATGDSFTVTAGSSVTLSEGVQFSGGLNANDSAVNLVNAINTDPILSKTVFAEKLVPAGKFRIFSLTAGALPNTTYSISYILVSSATIMPASGSNFANGIDQSADKALYNSITAQLATYILNLYPSATMAGVYTRVDNDRGVWKAPANVGVNLVNSPFINITDKDQENLNVDSVSGKSINAIRTFTGRGNLVWGARTLAGNDNEWRYVNVRRLFIFVEESVKKASEFVVFEANTAVTWNRVRSTIESFLTEIWREGALAGATTKDAYFVRVGLGTTMTAQDILEGRLIVEIGMAAVRPAEFIILRFMHKLQES